METLNDNQERLYSCIQPASILLALLLAFGAVGCSMKQMAINTLGDALSSESEVYASDDDIELVGSAVPFGLKTVETLLAQTPRHKGLLLAAVRGFTQYAYAYIELPAEQAAPTDFNLSMLQKKRAARLYLRARDYGLRGLRLDPKQLVINQRSDPGALLARLKRKDVDLIYWTAASWAAAISIYKDEDPMLLGDLPLIDRLLNRALQLSPNYNKGALDGLLIAVSMGRPGSSELNAEQAGRHFERAVELSGGKDAAPYVAYATAVLIPLQRKDRFRKTLARALAIDPDESPENKLSILIMQRHAQWLMEHESFLFPENEPGETS
ncbi:MAG: TRAP transporter TatT component family protein [Gammaproteobacteria bacterium]